MTAAPLVHFLDEQRRHRRTGAISAALVVVALAVSGIPLSVLISPVIVAGVAMAVGLAGLVVEMPPALDAWLGRVFHVLPDAWSAIRRADVDLPWELLAELFVLPGLVAVMVLWALVRFTFRHTGVGGVLRRMKTRPPRAGDLAEQRVVNLVQEVAVAAGVPPPRVLLIDAKSANVGAAGLRMDDATVVVTQGFVRRLPRDQQQAVIAHVMASVGNGDLTVAAEILTLIQTLGLIALVLKTPFLPAARQSLRLVGGTAVRALRGRADQSERELAVDTLFHGAGAEDGMDSDEAERLPDAHPLVLLFGYLPLLLTLGPVAAVVEGIIALTLLLTGPIVSLLWRTRRQLADATAIQLTRYPEALAQALRGLSALDMKVPGAVAVHFLFPVWDPGVDGDTSRKDAASTLMHLQLALEPRLRRLERLGASGERPKGWTALEGYTARDMAAAVGWLGVGGLLLALVLVLSALGASAVLWVLGWALGALGTASTRIIG